MAGLIFLEDTRFPAEAVERARRYSLIVAGSSWNAEVLRQHGLSRVRTVLQGVDPHLFYPRPREDRFPGRFVVFSGGKLEYRKGQDLVIAAFRRFQRRHPEALLLVAWHNFQRRALTGLESTGHVEGLPSVALDGRLRIREWLAENGVPPESVVDLGPIPNQRLAPILREADVALFPNRCEGGTNLAAMECLASGVPTLLSCNTGHLDLIDPLHCYPLRAQGRVQPVPRDAGVEGWGESEVEEMLEHLERVYGARSEARAVGTRAASFMKNMTWDGQMGRLLRVFEEAELLLTPARSTRGRRSPGRAAAAPSPPVRRPDRGR
jgi:glycosyltransferase involved in cell wall biosynthesis